MRGKGEVLIRGVFRLGGKKEGGGACRGCNESMEIESKHAGKTLSRSCELSLTVLKEVALERRISLMSDAHEL